MKISRSFNTIFTIGFVLSLSFSTNATIGDDATDEPTRHPEDTDEPTRPPAGDPFVTGDPHFRTWSGESYDFHGACDLVLLKNEHFDKSVGMDIHIRNKKMRGMFSYVDSAAVRIGDDTLEVKGGKDGGFWLNGEEGANIDSTVSLVSKFPLVIKKLSEKSRQFIINLGDEEAIVITTWNAMVRVSIKDASSENFGKSTGLMGTFYTGEKIGRDGITNIDDFIMFGQEWQVLPTEVKLFHEIGGAVQSPARCEIPSMSKMRRRLGDASVTVGEAEMACSRVDPAESELCIFDVIASNDKDLAGAYLL